MALDEEDLLAIVDELGLDEEIALETLKELAESPWRPGESVDLVERACASNVMYDSETRKHLNNALRASEPGFMGIDDISHDDGHVIYSTMPEDEMKMHKRSFKKGKDAVELSDDKTDVKPVMRYEALEGKADEDDTPETRGAAHSDCSCQEAARAAEGHDAMDEKLKARLKALEGKTPFTAEELAKFDETRLAAVEKAAGVVEEKKPEAKAAAEAPKAVLPTKDELFAAFPEIKAACDRDQAREAAAKAALLKTLADAKQTAYTEDELKAMDVPALTKLVTLMGKEQPVVDPIGNLPRTAAGSKSEDKQAPKPKSMVEHLRVLNEKKSA